MARRPKAKATNVSPSLLAASEEAVGAMVLAILDLGKLDGDLQGLTEVQWALDAASKKLNDATRWNRTFARVILAQQNKGMGDGLYDLTPIDATCAECNDYALLIDAPGKHNGVAVCRTCSFPWDGRKNRRRRAS